MACPGFFIHPSFLVSQLPVFNPVLRLAPNVVTNEVDIDRLRQLCVSLLFSSSPMWFSADIWMEISHVTFHRPFYPSFITAITNAVDIG
jgi:hypothetical protein